MSIGRPQAPKDELVGEHIRQHRRTMRLARGGVATLAVLLIAALVAALVAFQQRATAQRERDTAIFNQITAEADRLSSTDVSLAAQPNLTAYRMQRTPDLYTKLITAGNAALSTSLIGHINAVNEVTFSPDGHTLASGSDDHTVRLWNVTDPAHPTALGQPLTGHTSAVDAVAFSPDGYTLATSGGDRTVRLWAMNVNRAIQRICTGTRNILTPAKWTQYVSPDLPYQPPCPGP